MQRRRLSGSRTSTVDEVRGSGPRGRRARWCSSVSTIPAAWARRLISAARRAASTSSSRVTTSWSARRSTGRPAEPAMAARSSRWLGSSARSTSESLVPPSDSGVPRWTSPPWSRTISQSHTCSSSPSRCDETITVRPSSEICPDQRADVLHAHRVEAVGRLVEDDEVGIADQRGGDAETLLHPERVDAVAVVAATGQPDEIDQVVDADRSSAPPRTASERRLSMPDTPGWNAGASISAPTRGRYSVRLLIGLPSTVADPPSGGRARAASP